MKKMLKNFAKFTCIPIYLFCISTVPLFCQITEDFQSQFKKSILVLSYDDLFKQSQAGKAIFEVLLKKQGDLLQESQAIEESFISEELSLTKSRETLSVDDFQQLANEFDIKVEKTRKIRLNKDRELQNQFKEWRKKFVQIVAPIVRELMSENGAVIVFDKSTRGIIYEKSIDITNEIINELDKQYIENPNILDSIFEVTSR